MSKPIIIVIGLSAKLGSHVYGVRRNQDNCADHGESFDGWGPASCAGVMSTSMCRSGFTNERADTRTVTFYLAWSALSNPCCRCRLRTASLQARRFHWTMPVHASQRQGLLARRDLRHRCFIRCLIFAALFAAAMRSHVALLHQGGCSMRRAFQLPSPLQAAPARLPSAYRLASHMECTAVQSLDFAPVSHEPKVSLKNQRRFALGGYNLIAKGSGDTHACGPIVAFLSAWQHSHNIFGTVAELGVHHGRFTGILFMTARTTEKLFVADLFSQQTKNIDQSGLGNKKSFMRGITTYGLRPKEIHAVIEASTDELPFDLSRKARSEPFRLISVDASHT